MEIYGHLLPSADSQLADMFEPSNGQERAA